MNPGFWNRCSNISTKSRRRLYNDTSHDDRRIDTKDKRYVRSSDDTPSPGKVLFYGTILHDSAGSTGAMMHLHRHSTEIHPP